MADTQRHAALVRGLLRAGVGELRALARVLPPTAPDADVRTLAARAARLRAALAARAAAVRRSIARARARARARPRGERKEPALPAHDARRPRKRPRVIPAAAAAALSGADAPAPSTPGRFAAAVDLDAVDTDDDTDTEEDPSARTIDDAFRALQHAVDGALQTTPPMHRRSTIAAAAKIAALAGAAAEPPPADRPRAVRAVRDVAERAADLAAAHLDAEERDAFHVICGNNGALTPSEQGRALVAITVATFVGDSGAPWRAHHDDDVVELETLTTTPPRSNDGGDDKADGHRRHDRWTTATDTWLSSPQPASVLISSATKTALRALPPDDAIAFFLPLEAYADDTELELIASAVAGVLHRDNWDHICRAVPRLRALADSRNNPLVEITHLHKAIRKELEDIVAYCADVDITDDLQLQSVNQRFAFLRKVHLCHSEGEDTVLLKELHARMKSAAEPWPLQPDQEHSDEVKLFDRVSVHIAHLRSYISTDDAKATDAVPYMHKSEITAQPQVDDLKASLVNIVREISTHLIHHMNVEETSVLPLARQHFPAADLDRVVRRVMGIVPPSFLPELIPWVVSALSLDDQETFLRNVLRTASPDEFAKTVAAPLASAVHLGLADRSEWNELCLRIPELCPALLNSPHLSPSTTDSNLDNALGSSSGENSPSVAAAMAAAAVVAAESEGPVSEVLRVHKAIRVELRALLHTAAALPVDHIPNPNTLAAFAERVSFLGRMVGEHSRAEDNVLLPRLEERVPGVSGKYHGEHSDERQLFTSLSGLLEKLQCTADETLCARLVRKVRVITRTLLDEMVGHLKKEEDQLLPILTSNFSKEEQTEIVALLFGHMPSDRLQELLPWMIRVLSISEQTTMMTHIFQVTKSTMFETWLRTWFPDVPAKSEMSSRGNSSYRTGDEPLPCDRASTSQQIPSSHDLGREMRSELGGSASPASGNVEGGDETASAAAALVLLRGRDNMYQALRQIAADSSLSLEARTRIMQQVMLAPWSQREGRCGAICPNAGCGAGCGSGCSAYRDGKGCGTGGVNTLAATELLPSYRDSSKMIFGCSHYARGCKLRAACCGKLYTCRLCHDSTELHVMDRTATAEMLCMFCQTLQPVSNNCISNDCRKQMAVYFCAVCKFFDNDPSKDIYHCHSCNVCRAGKGLGKDFFHCMKCNQCMRTKFASKHVCVERAMESDCPVCHQYLFASTTPVKYLRCGHLMHASCKDLYIKKGNISCPVCLKSLEDMAPVFQKLDHLLAGESMPPQYRAARCDLWCLDCSRSSNARYHFLYNKCPHCSSYNTRVDRVDASS